MIDITLEMVHITVLLRMSTTSSMQHVGWMVYKASVRSCLVNSQPYTMSEQVVMRDDGLGEDGVVAYDAATYTFKTPSGDKRRTNSNPPDAPRRKLWKSANEDADSAKDGDEVRKPLWMETGYDIRRHLFKDIDWGKLSDCNNRRWAIIKVDTIATSVRHRCIRRFYIGDKDGEAHLEMQFYPCTAWKNLSEDYREKFDAEAESGHRLRYNPSQKVAPCETALGRLREFIAWNNIDVLLFNEKHPSPSSAVILGLCRELDINSKNIALDYTPLLDEVRSAAYSAIAERAPL